MGESRPNSPRADIRTATDAATSMSPARPPDDDNPADARRSSAVLLVARDLSLDEPCRDALSDAGVDCVFAVPSNQQALALLHQTDLFDAVVIGVGPGDTAAVELAERIQREHAETPTVIVSNVANLDAPGEVLQVDHESTNAPGAASMLQRAFSRAIAARQRSRQRPR